MLRFEHWQLTIKTKSNLNQTVKIEMQFHCFACGHRSEMLGLVKEVFMTSAKDWKAETLAKELQHGRRIFSANNDARDRRLHDS